MRRSSPRSRRRANWIAVLDIIREMLRHLERIVWDYLHRPLGNVLLWE
jgi:hypothetical protein